MANDRQDVVSTADAIDSSGKKIGLLYATVHIVLKIEVCVIVVYIMLVA